MKASAIVFYIININKKSQPNYRLRFGIELISKLTDAKLTEQEKKEVLVKAKKIIERDKLTDCKLTIGKQ
jgi:hypothetical protein